jgi:hypothetical protein
LWTLKTIRNSSRRSPAILVMHYKSDGAESVRIEQAVSKGSYFLHVENPFPKPISVKFRASEYR